jgi:crotonobetainyl-CoA:carnitine CoA-transferase CaiB-like acyl-CoA transferase
MDTKLVDELMAVAGEELVGQDAEIVGEDPVFPLPWRIGEAGAATIAASGVAAARLWQLRTGRRQRVRVDVDAAAAAMRGDRYLRRETPSADAAPEPRAVRGEGGDIYLAKDDRWVYLHRGFAHHRARIAALLDGADDAASLEQAVRQWDAEALEDAVHAAGACAGVVRTRAEWLDHPQAIAVAGLPLFEIERIADGPPKPMPPGARPLDGFRVLDLTRVLAGPTCGRTLAEHGAEVLRIGTDLLPNNETQNIATGHGKRSTVLDLSSGAGRERLQALIRDADVFSQGYRPGALAGLGFDVEDVAALRPGIIYLSLNAFSHVGPWQHRRGFDTLVQAVSGICHDYARDGRPRHMPVSALDYSTGYLAAFGVMVALARRAREGGSYHVRVSLAQTARWLTSLLPLDAARVANAAPDLPPERIDALSVRTDTPFGPVTHLAPIVEMSETPARWELPSVPLDHDPPEWLTAPQIRVN